MRLSFLIRLMLFLVTLELEAPTVLEVDIDTVLLRNPELKAQQPSAVTYHLTMKYGRSQWKSFSLDALLLQQGILLSGLFPNTPYVAFATVITRSGKKVNSPKVDFTKKCSEPSPPTNSMVKPLKNSFTQLIWNHPSIFREKITEFRVDIAFLHTRLRIKQSFKSSSIYIPIQRDTITYRIKAYLPPSTIYQLSVQALNLCGDGRPVRKDYRVPGSLGFTSVKELDVHRTETSIELKLPSVVNDTSSSAVSVFVKGSSTCSSLSVPEDLRQRVNMKKFEKGWLAARYEAPKSLPKYLTIGKDPNGYGSANCFLYPDETYVITIVVIDSVDGASAVTTFPPILPISKIVASTKSEPTQPNLVWLTIPLILSICILLLFVWRRKFFDALRGIRRENLVAYPQTFTNIFKSKTSCTSQEPPPSPMSSDADLLDLPGIISTFEGVAWNRYSRSIKIKNFEDYVKESIATELLKSQFMLFPRGQQKPCKYGSLLENRIKNRYADIIPYDCSRVVLKKLPDDPFSDYINANYVPGFRKKTAYIAAQGPKPQTVVDFWRMIWQEKSLVICMLANVTEGDQVKCEQYWPEFGVSKTYGEIIVTTENHHVFADYTYRTLRVTCTGESRKIEHLHYTGWPDHTVPSYTHSVVAYLTKLRTMAIDKGPVVVHCSAGVGRTGTIILCDMCLRRATTKGTIDVLADFKKLRDSRLNMIDNDLQYLFAHVVIAECLVSLPTALPCNNDLPQAIEKLKKALPQHIERLRSNAWQDQALHPLAPPRPLLPEQLAKNRFPELAPANSGLVHLRRYPRYENKNDYISAVIVDGVRVKKQYLASQLPLPSTLPEFWRLIAEQRVELVIVLQQPDPKDRTCCDIIPGEASFEPVPFIVVESKTNSNHEKSPWIDELVLTDTSEKTPRTQQVTILTCPEWGLGKCGKPPPPQKLVELWIASENIHREKGPTLVLCHDGVSSNGLYLALSFLLERMAVERECDVIFAVRAIRRSRPDFIQSEEQFEYLYDAAATYIESFETYANFA